jgi:hypothetical protein
MPGLPRWLGQPTRSRQLRMLAGRKRHHLANSPPRQSLLPRYRFRPELIVTIFDVTVIQVETYDLKPEGIERFVELDAALQTEVVYQLKGIERRTTARSETGWVTITLWDCDEDAAAALAVLDAHSLEHDRRLMMTSPASNSYFTTL